jgi:hypothetical protein
MRGHTGCDSGGQNEGNVGRLIQDHYADKKGQHQKHDRNQCQADAGDSLSMFSLHMPFLIQQPGPDGINEPAIVCYDC